ELSAETHGHATFAEISSGGFQHVILPEVQEGRHFQGNTEITPALALHQSECGGKASHGIHRSNRFLEYEIGPHLKGLLGSGATIQNGEGNGVLVAGSLAEALQHFHTAFEMVA